VSILDSSLVILPWDSILLSPFTIKPTHRLKHWSDDHGPDHGKTVKVWTFNESLGSQLRTFPYARALSHDNYRNSTIAPLWPTKAEGATTLANASSVMKLRWIDCLTCWGTLRRHAQIPNASPTDCLDLLRLLEVMAGVSGWSFFCGSFWRSRFSSRGLLVLDAITWRNLHPDPDRTGTTNLLRVHRSIEVENSEDRLMLGQRFQKDRSVVLFFYAR